MNWKDKFQPKTILLYKEDYEKLRKVAFEKRITISELIREAIKKYLK